VKKKKGDEDVHNEEEDNEDKNLEEDNFETVLLILYVQVQGVETLFATLFFVKEIERLKKR